MSAGEDNPLLVAALDYAWRDWSVVPVWPPIDAGACSCPLGARCRSSGKHPLTENGLSAASTDEGTIRRWWARWPTANVAVVMEPSGLLALDVDAYHCDDDKLAALESTLGPLPRSPIQRSGSGQGRHLLFKHPGGKVGGLIGGIVVRARAYVVVAPSRHKSGGCYAWQDGLAPDQVELAELPPKWKRALESKVEIGDVGMPPESDEPDWLRKIPQVERVRRMRAHLESEPGEEMGVSRPGMTFDVARTCVRGFAVRDPEAVLAAMQEVYDPKCKPPWQERIGRHVVCAYSKAHTPEWGSRYEPHDWWKNMRTKAERPPGPTRTELLSTLSAFAGKRTTDADKRADVDIAKLVHKNGQIIDPADVDRAIRVVSAVIEAQHPTATDKQIAELLMSSISTAVMPLADLESRVGEVRAGMRQRDEARRDPDEDLPEPADDLELRGQLLPGKDESVRSCGPNIERVLRFSSATRGHLRYNELTKAIDVTGGRFADLPPNGLDIAIKNWLMTHWQINASSNEVREQILHVARMHSREPVQEYLRALTWDGVSRIDAWLETYCRADVGGAHGSQEYVRRVGSMFLIAAVARALDPGCKVDTVLVLEGDQGSYKSTCFAVLGGEWYCDTPIAIGDKDGRMLAGAAWICEIAELASILKSSLESHKAFLSQQRDHFRPPYGRVIEPFPRRSVFGATYNPNKEGEASYLEDETGERRWWPVRVGEIDVTALRRDRDQLWAEAVARYQSSKWTPQLAHAECPGERWWFERGEQALADAVTATRKKPDAWLPMIQDYYEAMGRKPFRLADLADHKLGIRAADLKSKEASVASSLRRAGFAKSRRVVSGKQSVLWDRAPEPA